MEPETRIIDVRPKDGVAGVFGRGAPPKISTCASKCWACQKFGLHTEQVTAMGRSFHKMCLKCRDCNKLMDSGSVVEHDEQPFCLPCHQKNFGTKGYGYGMGIGTLQSEYTTDTNVGSADQPKSAFPPNPDHSTVVTIEDLPRCPICNKSVYHAEEIVALNKS